ncbi:mitochondrial glycine transporter A-like isoform X2 [Argonauta hians]
MMYPAIMTNYSNAPLLIPLPKALTVLQVSICKSFLAGSLSGTCSALLFQPLDLVKTRLQSPIKTSEGRLSVVSVVTHVLKQDNITGLWRGLAPTIARSVPGIGIYFSLLFTFKSHLGSDKPGVIESLTIGGIARGITVTVMHPSSVLKTRYEDGSYDYRRLTEAFKKIYITEGFSGLYSGYVATMARDIPFSALYFTFYSQTKQLFRTESISESYLPLVHFNCGIVSGLLASLLTQPADVIKTHMQLCPITYPTLYQTVLHIYKTDGIIGFQRGYIPRAVRRCLMAAMAWTVYEKMMMKFGLKT